MVQRHTFALQLCLPQPVAHSMSLILSRQGINPEGKAYQPAFPSEVYAAFLDQDVADLWAAIRAVPAI